ncbi:MAG: hypothetical protein JXR77_13645 [Lentisphaeria bacterium]|nr:hypothetical protein [Lentisphaeria bacterium]
MTVLDPTRWDVRAIGELLVRCGTRARRAQAGVPWQVKADGTLVTDIDRGVEALLRQALDRPEQGSRVIGEETVAEQGEGYLDAALKGIAWIVDPIDGTAPYAHGLDSWGVSIGFARHGVLEQGGVILPARGEMLLGRGDGVVWAAGAGVDAGCEPEAVPELRPFVPCPAPWREHGMLALGQRWAKGRVLPWPNPVIATGSAVDVLTGLMFGRVMGYIGHMKLWDLAGVLPLLQRAGIEGRLLDGTPITAAIASDVLVLEPGHPERWALRSDCVFGAPGVVARLLARLRGEGCPGDGAGHRGGGCG